MSQDLNEFIEIHDDHIYLNINIDENEALIQEIKEKLDNDILSIILNQSETGTKDVRVLMGRYNAIKIKLNANTVNKIKELGNEYDFSISQKRKRDISF